MKLTDIDFAIVGYFHLIVLIMVSEALATSPLFLKDSKSGISGGFWRSRTNRFEIHFSHDCGRLIAQQLLIKGRMPISCPIRR
jgi:hypothetical protein